MTRGTRSPLTHAAPLRRNAHLRADIAIMRTGNTQYNAGDGFAGLDLYGLTVQNIMNAMAQARTGCVHVGCAVRKCSHAPLAPARRCPSTARTRTTRRR